MKLKQFLSIMLGMTKGVPNSKTQDLLKREQKSRPCLVCAKKHKHNNSFCSAQCCGLYEKQRKSLLVESRKEAERIRIEKHRNSPCFSK